MSHRQSPSSQRRWEARDAERAAARNAVNNDGVPWKTPTQLIQEARAAREAQKTSGLPSTSSTGKAR